MKAAILSDTHENMEAIDSACALIKEEKAELILHAGDIISPIALRRFQNAGALMIAVYGNNDGERLLLEETIRSFGAITQGFYEGELAGKKVLMMHEPRGLEALVRSQSYDLIVYGHTHKVDMRKEGKTTVINPGELGGWLHAEKNFVMMDIPSMEYRLIKL